MCTGSVSYSSPAEYVIWRSGECGEMPPRCELPHRPSPLLLAPTPITRYTIASLTWMHRMRRRRIHAHTSLSDSISPHRASQALFPSGCHAQKQAYNHALRPPPSFPRPFTPSFPPHKPSHSDLNMTDGSPPFEDVSHQATAIRLTEGLGRLWRGP